MKRLALLLGSLLVVSAAASAKEVVPAPVVVQETPVQIVEKEVIVYREKEPEWRPSGFFKVQEKYYGETENNKFTGADGGWNNHNRYGRLEAEAGIQMTERQAMDFRIRNYQSWSSLGEKKNDQVRVRYYFDHGNVGDSKVNALSMVRYQKDGSDHLAEYRLEFDFAEYLFNNDFVKTSKAVIGPRYIYSWTGHSDYTNSVGLYADLINEYPLGFSTEIEIDGAQYNKYKTEINGNKDDFQVNVTAKLMHNWNLYTNDKFSFDWAFEGGYDTFDYSTQKVFAKAEIDPTTKANSYDDAKYSVYAQPSFRLTYNATKFVSVYGEIGAEYRNWVITANSEAKNWRWQPYGALGLVTTF